MAATPSATKRPPAKSAAKSPARKAPAKKPAARRAAARRNAGSAAGISTTTAFSIGAIVVAAGMALTGFIARRQIAAWIDPLTEGHEASDLLGDTRPDAADRAPVDFRPDPTAAVSAAYREALRPATIASNGNGAY